MRLSSLLRVLPFAVALLATAASLDAQTVTARRRIRVEDSPCAPSTAWRVRDTNFTTLTSADAAAKKPRACPVVTPPVDTTPTVPPVIVPPVVVPPAVSGSWQNITPPVPQPWANTNAFFYGWISITGAASDAPKTLYVMVDHAGDQYSSVWKSLDGGSSWAQTNQGPNNALREGGFVVVDPTNSNTVYAGVIKSSSGLFKSTNGGASWTPILPANYEHDIYGLSIDPNNHSHLLLTFHSCQVGWPLTTGGGQGNCGVLESRDGGATWLVRQAAWTGLSQFAFFVGRKNDGGVDTNGDLWVVSNQSGQGLWRTENAGASWAKVGDFDQTHGMQSLYRASSGALYMGSVGKIFRSTDNGRSWFDTGVQSSGDGYGGIVGDGTRVWAMLSNTGASAFGPYRWQTLPESDVTSSPANSKWSFFGTTTYQNGPHSMLFDPVNRVLYSAHWGTGVYRLTLGDSAATPPPVVTPPVVTPPVVTPPVVTPPAGPAGTVTMSVDPTRTFPISRFIYGVNEATHGGAWANATMPNVFTFNRFGGNRLSAYNWETNYSNAGSDYNFQNDQLLSSSTVPGDAVAWRASQAFARTQAFMPTIPMLPGVAADACQCNVGTLPASLSHFRTNLAAKGSAFALAPNANDASVAQDEFVNWLKATYPGRFSHATAPLMLSLDNEPDIWKDTHAEIATAPTYTSYVARVLEFSKAIKAVAPDAMLFGPATATYTGISLLGQYPALDPVYRDQNFVDVFLDRMRVESATVGRRLIDVLDVHFYDESWSTTPTGGRFGINNDYAGQDSAAIAARVQAPRSLWDATYTGDNSWVSGAAGGPIRLIPRLQAQIAAHYPGTKLAITEYYYGRAGDISGGIAQADVLGIFGREGVFAASLWPNAGIWAAPYGGNGNTAYAYAFSAFRMFRDYDGAGSTFGDTGLAATTSDLAASSIYASRDAAGRVVLVVLNKAQRPVSASIAISGSSATSATPYLLSAASPMPIRQSDVAVAAGRVVLAMPALSVITLVLR